MKRILFIRHADASWEETPSRDIDKPLTFKGQNEAQEVGSILNRLKIHPQLFYCSSAARTVKTCRIIIKELDVKPPVEYNQELYSDTSRSSSELIRRTKNNIDFVAIIAHNPYMHTLYNNLCDYITFKNILEYPTCGAMLCANKSQKWIDVDIMKSTITNFYYPEEFKPHY